MSQGTNDDSFMVKEYKQWLFVTKDLYPFIDITLSLDDDKKLYEGRNLIQGWLMGNNQLENIEKYEHYPLLPRVTILDGRPLGDTVLELVVEIENKNLFNDDDSKPTLAVRDILQYIETSHNEYDREPLNLDPVVENGIISVGEFRDKKFQNLSYLRSEEASERWNLRDIMTMCLRYECIGNRGYQWSLPREVHMCYYDHYNVRYEGFASPLNSTFLTLHEGQFCSLFPDTDRVFGSMGDFFEIDLSKYPGGWSVNPPFIENIIKKVSEKIINALDSGVEVTFFCTFPLWKDNEAWISMSESQYNLRSLHRKFVLQDVYGELFIPCVKMSVFCLSHLKDINLDEFDSILKQKIEYFQTSEIGEGNTLDD